MGQEPRGLHAAIKRALDLSSAHPLLAGADQLDRLEPEPQREVAILEDRADPHGKGLATGIALAEAGSARLALKPADLRRINIAAMRTNRPVRPQHRLYIGEGRFFVMKVGRGQNGLGHGLNSLCPII